MPTKTKTMGKMVTVVLGRLELGRARGGATLECIGLTAGDVEASMRRAWRAYKTVNKISASWADVRDDVEYVERELGSVYVDGYEMRL